MASKTFATSSMCRFVLTAARNDLLKPHGPRPAVVNQSTAAAASIIQPKEEVTPVRVGDSFVIMKRFSERDIFAYSQMTFNANPLHLDSAAAREAGLKKATVPESLIYSAVSGCGDQYMSSKRTATVILNVHNKHPDPLYVGEDLQVELRVVAREGRKVKLQCLSTEPITGKVVAQAVADCVMPRDHPE